MNRETAEALARFACTLRPSWKHDDVMQVLADIRERDDLPGLARRITHTALLPEAFHPRHVVATWERTPRIRPGEFAPTNPIPSDEALRRIAALRQVVQAANRVTIPDQPAADHDGDDG